MTDKNDPRHPEHKAAVLAAELFGNLPDRSGPPRGLNPSARKRLTWTEAMGIADEMMDQYDEATRDDSDFIARSGWITRRAEGTPLKNGIRVLLTEALIRGYRMGKGDA